MRNLRTGLFITAFLAVSTSALAQDWSYSNRSRVGTFDGGGAIGFTISPSLFLFAFNGEYFVHQNVAIGPLLQMGLDDNVFLLAPTFNVRGVFDLPPGDVPSRIKPFVQGGVGIAYVNVDPPGPGDADDLSLLINFGFGVDVYLTDHFALGNNLMFNITPTWDGDDFFFAWQFVSAKYQF